MPANDTGVEALPAVVDATAAAALFRAWRPRLAQIAGFDLGAVREIDSAGVALLRAVQAAQRAGGGPRWRRCAPCRSATAHCALRTGCRSTAEPVAPHGLH